MLDVVIIGAGHNGLTCAAYLARAGLAVKVVERRPVVGGAALTEEFHPGFRNSVYSYLVSLLDPAVIRDLELQRHGLTVLDRPGGTLAPQPDGRFLQLPRDAARAREQISKFSHADAVAFDEFERQLLAIAGVLRDAALKPPPNFGGGWRDLLGLAGLGNRLRRLTPGDQSALADLFASSVGDYLDRWFETDALKGIFGFEGVIGNYVGPYHPGSAYVLLHHAFGQVDGRAGAWGHARGGMGAVSAAMAAAATQHGVEIETGAATKAILMEKDHAVGVVLEDGRTVRARAVAGAINPRTLYLDLVEAGAMPADFIRRMRHWRCRSGTFRMNVALSELPSFPGLPENDAAVAHLSGTIDICPSLAYIEAAYRDATTTGWAKAPVVSMCIPSTLDDSLAPPGQHVASLFCQHFDPELPDGRDWDDVKEDVADLIIDTVDAYAPNFRQSVLGRQIKSPKDLERDLGLLGGDIFHGALHLDQLFSLRPAPGFADYRAPLAGLYLCGSGAHPGGGVTGLPGRNAAREIIRDLRRG